MDAERWRRMRSIYESALDLGEDARERFLEETCGDDADLMREVRGMIDSALSAARGSDSGDDFLSPLAGDAPAARLEAGARVGSFVLGEEIASGGMGSVHEAWQEEPKRRVAVKLLRGGRSGAAAVRRFRFEAELLAQLQHPNIATVFEAGVHTDDDGGETPYLAMEYVEGARDLLAFADDQRLDLEERLELFLQACDAAQHGHQQGVVHRDLKPHNVLVDREGRVRVIDFGIARAVGRASGLGAYEGPATELTGAGEILGTLGYMAPEQFDGDSSRVDTRSDVYALGVVLHELVCGRPPLELAGLSVLEIARAVTEQPVALPTEVPRDLGWILLQSLAKERDGRYASASELAADVRRFLAGEPVEAGAPGALYRAAKFVRRNRVAVGLSVLAVVGVLSGGGAAFFGLLEAQRARDLLADERDAAVAEAEKFGGMSDLLTGMLLAVTPDQEGRDVRVADLLDAGASRLEAVERADVAVPIHRVMGLAFDNLGLHAESIEQLERAVARADAEPDFDALARAAARVDLARVLTLHGDDHRALDELDAAETELSGAVVGDDAELERFTLGIELDARRSNALVGLGRADEAVALTEASMVRAEGALGPIDATTRMVRREHAIALADAGRRDDALTVLAENVERATEAVGPSAPDTLHARYAHAVGLLDLSRDEEAAAGLEALLPEYEQLYGRDSGRTCQLLSVLAQVTTRLGRLDDAYLLFEEALPCLETHLPPSSEYLIEVRGNLASLLDLRQDDAGALDLRRAAHASAERWFGPDDARTLHHAHNLAILLDKLGGFQEVIELETHVIARREEQLGPDHPDTTEAREMLGRALASLGRIPEAVEVTRVVLDARTRQLGPEHPVTLRAHNELVSLHAYSGNLQAALDEGERVLERLRRSVDESSPGYIITVRNQGAYARDLGQMPLAVEYAGQAHELAQTHGTLDSHETGLTAMYYGEALVLDEQADAAVDVLRTATEAFLERPGLEPRTRARAHRSYGTSLIRTDRVEQGRAEWERALELYERAGDERNVAKMRQRLEDL